MLQRGPAHAGATVTGVGTTSLCPQNPTPLGRPPSRPPETPRHSCTSPRTAPKPNPAGFGVPTSRPAVPELHSQRPPKFPSPANSQCQISLCSPNGGLGAAPRPVPGYLGQFIPPPPSENVLFSAETIREGRGAGDCFWASAQILLPSPASGSPSLPGCGFWGAEPCRSPTARILGAPCPPALQEGFFPKVWDGGWMAMEAAAAGDGEGGLV